MPKLVMEEQADFVPLPEDSLITVMIVGIELKEVNVGDRSWEKLSFTFKIKSIDVLGDGSEDMEPFAELIDSKIYGDVSARFTTATENKLRQWVQAVLGMELDAGFELDTDLLIGRKVRALTTQYTKGEFVRHKVGSLVPLSAAPAASIEEPPF